MRVIVPSKYEQSTLQETNIPEKLKNAALEGAHTEYLQNSWGYVLNQYLHRGAFSLYKFIVETRKDMYLHFHNNAPTFTLFASEKGLLQVSLGDFELNTKTNFAQLAYLPGPKDFRLYFKASEQTIFYKIDFNLPQLEKTAGYFSRVPTLHTLLQSAAESPAGPVSLEEIPLHKKEKDVFEQLGRELQLPGGPSFFLDPRIADVLRWYISQLGREGDDALIASAGFYMTREDLKNARAVKTLLETNFAARYTLSKLAFMAGMSPRKLQQVFRYDVKDTISGFRSKVLMEEAARLLKETILPVKSVALSVGFKYTADFDKLFKRLYGVTPKEWRHPTNT